jgi:hypothetical protein
MRNNSRRYKQYKRFCAALSALLLLAGLLFADSANAQNRPGWCNPEDPPRINIRPESRDIKYDFSKSMAQINRKDIDTKNPYSDDVISKAGGLMSGGIRTKKRFKIATRTQRRQSLACAWFDTITVRIMIEPTIYVAREFEKGSCPRRAILEHEHKHIRVDREIVNKYARKIGRAVKDYVDSNPVYGPVRANRLNNLQQRMSDQLNRLVSTIGKRMERERGRRQQGIDTLEEYERVRAQCSESQWPDAFSGRG